MLRRQSASQLESRLIAELKPLAMDKVKFQVQILPHPPTVAGADKITFMFSPNPGEPLQPLIAIASGGEMSRFLLALKACFPKLMPQKQWYLMKLMWEFPGESLRLLPKSCTN